jgi:hypothetical protein
LIVALAFVGCLGLSLWAKKEATPEVAMPPGPPTTEDIGGWPKSVDPLQVLGRARELTSREQLRGIDAQGVGADGLVDLTKPGSRVRYSFQSAEGKGPQPPQPRGSSLKRGYCGKQQVHLKSDGLVADPDFTGSRCPKRAKDPLPDPRCTTQKIWQYAMEKKGAAKDSHARIEYYRSRVGPAWRFTVPGTATTFSLYGDCERELKGRDAVGSVP